MEYRTRNVFDYTKVNRLKSNTIKFSKNKELIQKTQNIKFNQRHSKIINFILLENILIILFKNIANTSFNYSIEIRVNKLGENQIISNKYIGPLPSNILINNNISLSFNDRKINIGNINDKIKLIWYSSIINFSYLFDNCKTISTIIFDISNIN